MHTLVSGGSKSSHSRLSLVFDSSKSENTTIHRFVWHAVKINVSLSIWLVLLNIMCDSGTYCRKLISLKMHDLIVYYLKM